MIDKNPRLKTKEDIVIKDFSKGKRRFKKARFEKEKSVYEQLEETPVNTPEIVEVDEENLVLEIEKIANKDKNREDEFKVVEELVKFQFSGIEPKNSLILNIIDYPSIRYIANATSSIHKLGFKLYCKVMWELIDYHLNYPKLKKPIVIHNDFHRNNSLKRKNNNIAIIDVESCIKSRRWVFRDIVHFSYNKQSNSFDEELINYYISLCPKTLRRFSKKQIEKEKKMGRIFHKLLRLYYNHIITI
ncbi:MAG: hypothetical protein LAT82_02050 [Nanoarchaeota archaeon]|nr:hypothetical protein [Nanoarchaeota archaeon]